MDTTKPRHHLSHIDLKNRKAVCSVCGDTPIFLKHSSKDQKLSVGCLTKRRKDNSELQRHKRQQQRLQDANWKPMHKLSQIDPIRMTGVCSVCGSTPLRKYRIKGNRRTVYLCKNKYYVPGSRIWKSQTATQELQETHKKMIDQFKVERGCQNCGCNADPLELELYVRGVRQGQYTTSNLVKFSRKRLLHFFQVCSIYCVRCYPQFQMS